jgi:hypothetical protein
MKVGIVYVFPIFNSQLYEKMAWRFCRSYMDFPPGLTDHTIHVYANGAPAADTQKRIFRNLPVEFHHHNNAGKDIGAFQMAAEQVPCDLLLCLGANVHFRQAGWLDHIVNSFLRNGPAMYGCWGFHQPALHIRTTAFWMPPELLNSYPTYVSDSHRYDFEHGQSNSIVQHVKREGYQNYMVTWRGTFPESEWHHVANEHCLMLDQHTDRIGYK